MKKSKFHFVRAVITQTTADLGYWSLFSKLTDKMSNFLANLFVCVSVYVCVRECMYVCGPIKIYKIDKKYPISLFLFQYTDREIM